MNVVTERVKLWWLLRLAPLLFPVPAVKRPPVIQNQIPVYTVVDGKLCVEYSTSANLKARLRRLESEEEKLTIAGER